MLGEMFTMNATINHLTHSHSTSAFPHVNGRRRDRGPDWTVSPPRQRSFHLSQIATILLAVLVLATAIAALVRAPGGHNDEQPTFAVAAATPIATGVDPLPYQPIDIADCATTARPPGTVRNLYGEAPSTEALLPPYNRYEEGTKPNAIDDAGNVLGSLDKIDRVTEAAIYETLHQLTACRLFMFRFGEIPLNYDDIDYDGRFFALYSDNFFRRELGVLTGTGGEIGLISFWGISGPESMALDDARVLPDGRVVAIVSQSPITIFKSRLVVFAPSEQGWLVDEMADIRPPREALEHMLFSQYLEVVLRNDEPSLAIPMPTVDGFVNDRPVTITLANFGPVEQEFRIDSLGVKVSVPVGHSVSFALTPPAGLYVAESYVPDPLNPQGRPLLRLQSVIRIVNDGTAVGGG
jgi:hypothetical protein